MYYNAKTIIQKGIRLWTTLILKKMKRISLFIWVELRNRFPDGSKRSFKKKLRKRSREIWNKKKGTINMEDFGLSVIEVLATNANTDIAEIKKMLVRTTFRECKNGKRMCIPMTSYKPLIVHFDTLLRELYIEDAKSFIERLDASEKVYIEEIYTFLIEHFHNLNENETMWKILILMERGCVRG